jgi:hypothetical protein
MTRPRAIAIYRGTTLVWRGKARSLRAALEDYSGSAEFPHRNVIIVGNTMLVNGVEYVAREAVTA